MDKLNKGKPFLTADFSPEGGGIDFLGLRQVNLHILETYLLPGINNQTNDPGTYCIGAWIPWKFREICKTNPENYTSDNFKIFKETIEIIMSYSMDKDSKATEKYGMVNNRIGVTQKVILPQVLMYKNVKRTDATSIYAAPLYGPSLKYLNLLYPSGAIDVEGKQSSILVAKEDTDTEFMCRGLDKQLSSNVVIEKTFKFAHEEFTESEVEKLGESGLHPGYFRHMSNDYKERFKNKLLPKNENGDGKNRYLSYLLIIELIKNHNGLSSDDIRNVMLTRRNLNGQKMIIEESLSKHLELWSIFNLRQYQRYTLELFRQAFEESVSNGFNRIETIAKSILDEPYFEKVNTLRSVFEKETQGLIGKKSFEEMSKAWTEKILPGDEGYIEEVSDDEDSATAVVAFRCLIRWWLRLDELKQENEEVVLLGLGNLDRISQDFLYKWIKDRIDIDIHEFLSDLLSLFVFSQHLRVSLSRFDGRVQRMRFVLDDNGIVPSSSVGKKIADYQIPWMADRLECFLLLLKEVDVLTFEDKKWVITVP